MKVDLNTLDFRQTFELINWCVANRIDYERAGNLMFAWYADPLTKTDIIWELDIPEEYMTFWLLKWSK